MAEIGWAGLGIVPTFNKFGVNLERGTSKAMLAAGATGGSQYGDSAARAAHKGFGSTLRKLGGLGAALGVAGFVKDSIQLEATFGKTMAQIRVATGAPAEQLARLDALAIKLGKDTIFSANDASGAMLELAKNGIKPAVIESGALSSALTLAAAGSVDMTEAAQTMGNSLNAFNLKGKDSRRVAAALAGAANASSASVSDLAYALAQVGLGANSVGFSIEETTGVLAGFANAGIQGSDAGTALKVMLDRLQPTTTRAEAAMRGLGIITEEGKNQFITANGEFKSAAEIAELLKRGTEDLTRAEAKRQVTQAFGQDAQRAALVLAKEGAKGIRELTAATSDQAAADRMAKANMEGTAGAIERLKGSWETAKLQFGKFIAPAVVTILDKFSQGIEDSGPKLKALGDWLKEDGIPAMREFAGHVKDVATFLHELPKPAKIAGLTALVGGVAALKVRGGGSGALGTAGRALGLAKPIPVFVVNQGFGGAGGGAGGGKTPPVVPLAKGSSGLWNLLKGKPTGLTAAGGLAGVVGGLMTGITLSDRKLPDMMDEKDVRAWERVNSEAVKFNDATKKLPNQLDQGNTSAENLLATILRVDRSDPKVEYRAPGFDELLRKTREYDSLLDGLSNRLVTTIMRTRYVKNDTGEGGGTISQPPNRSGDGVNVNIERVVAQDYNDMMYQIQNRARRNSLDGRRG